MISLTPNPILLREARARWRGGRPFVLMFLFSGLLAAVITFAYGWTVLDPVRSAREVRYSSIIGHELFMHLTWVQTLAWMLLGPALTAPVIAGERERGLLEGLQLSPLSPWRIVAGKFYAAMAFMAMMMLVALPVLAICLMLGGVSPGELWLAVLLHASVAIFGSSLGIACSARSHRSASAVARAFAVLILGCVASGVASALAATPAAMTGIWNWGHQLCGLISMTNPIVAALSISVQDVTKTMTKAAPIVGDYGIPPAVICIGFCLVLSVLLMWSAMAALGRPLAEAQWSEWKDQVNLKRSRRRRGQATPQSETPPATGAEPAATPRSPVPRWEVPALSRWRFENPVLQREFRGKTRLRQTSPLHVRTGIVLAVLIGLSYLRVFIATLSDPHNHSFIFQFETCILAGGILLTSALMGAGSLAREREAGTWESLNLSLLKPVQIIGGKLATILLSCAFWVLLLLPLLWACVGLRSGQATEAVTPVTVLLAMVLVAATAWWGASFGLLLSWLCRRTMTAISWAIAILIGLFCLLPVAAGVLHILSDDFLLFWHPLAAVIGLADGRRQPGLPTPLITSTLLFIGGLAFLLLLHRNMRRDIRERDGNFAATTSPGERDASGAALASGGTA